MTMSSQQRIEALAGVVALAQEVQALKDRCKSHEMNPFSVAKEYTQEEFLANMKRFGCKDLDEHVGPVKAEENGVQWRHITNCHYIFVDGRVLCTHGYKGKNVFEAVVAGGIAELQRQYERALHSGGDDD